MIQNYLFDVNDTEIFAFQCGYLTGALVALLFFVLLGLLPFLLRYPKHAKGVALRSAHGQILISATAIADLVKSIGSEFSELEILKVALFHDRKALRLHVAVSFPYNPDGESITVVAVPPKEQSCELVAQSVEHRPFKAVVQGSSPCRLTISLFPFCFLLFFSFKF